MNDDMHVNGTVDGDGTESRGTTTTSLVTALAPTVPSGQAWVMDTRGRRGCLGWFVQARVVQSPDCIGGATATSKWGKSFVHA